MYKVYFQDIKPIKVEKMSDVINYLVCHNAIGYEKLNNKSAYEILEEKYKRALKEKNKYKKIVRELEKSLEKVFEKMEEKQIEIDGSGYYYTDLLPIEEVLDRLKELKGNKNEDKR